MAKNTSVTLGEHFEGFIADSISKGRFETLSEAVREGLRLLEEREKKIEVLNQALSDGDNSGISKRTLRQIAQETKHELK